MLFIYVHVIECLKVLDEFSAKYPPSTWASANESNIDFPALAAHLQKFQNPKEADALMKIQSELDETKIILVSKMKFNSFVM